MLQRARRLPCSGLVAAVWPSLQRMWTRAPEGLDHRTSTALCIALVFGPVRAPLPFARCPVPTPGRRQQASPLAPGPAVCALGPVKMQKDSSQPMDSSMNQLINASIQPSVLPSADLPSVYSSIVCVPACPSMHPAAHLATHTSACPPITHPSTHPPIIHPALQPLTPTSSAKTGFTFLREWRMFSRGALSTSSSTTGRVFRVRERRGKGLPFVGHLPRVSVTLESCVLSLTCE